MFLEILEQFFSIKYHKMFCIFLKIFESINILSITFLNLLGLKHSYEVSKK